MNEELRSYVESQLANGTAEGEIRKTLLEQGGWSDGDLNAVFSALFTSHNKAPTPKEEHEEPEKKVSMDTNLATQPLDTQQPSVTPDTPTAPNTQQPSVTPDPINVKPSGGGRKHTRIIIILLIVLIIGGGVAAFVKFIGPSLLRKAPYNQDNLISGLMVSMAEINTFSNTFTGTLKVEQRDDGAEPFSVEKLGNIDELRKQYTNDSKRFDDVGNILRLVSYEPSAPESIQNLADYAEERYSVQQNFSSNDPVTNKVYEYKKITQDDFELTVTFETSDATKTLKDAYDFDENATKIDGNTVTFTKNSPTWLYFPNEPPKPFLVEFGETVRLLPSELFFDISASIDSDSSDSKLANWKFTLDVNGDFGDLTYKVGGDALKKDNDFYFKIRHFPEIFGVPINSIKNNWIKISDSSDDENSNNNFFLSIFESIPEAEEEYKKNKEQFVAYSMEIATIADEERLLSFVSKPTKEDVDGKKLYRYDLEPNKDALIPFMERSIQAGEKYDNLDGAKMLIDEGFLEYLKSDEFEGVFEYFNNNTSLTMWIDESGILHKVEYSIRAIPPDTATQLKDKQVRLNIQMQLRNINEPVEIVAPAEYRDIKEVIEEIETNLYGAQDIVPSDSNKIDLLDQDE